MDQGFFHPARGYWQAVGGASREIRAAYPEGTIEVPLKPGADFDWIEGEWRPVQPAPTPVPQELSFAQFVIGLTETGWITDAEAEAWLGGNALPAAVEAALGQIPAQVSGQKPRLRARARALRPSVVMRNNELLAMMAAQRGATQEQLDNLFRTYSEI